MHNKELRFSELSVGVRRLLQNRIPPQEKVLACYEYVLSMGENVGYVLTEKRAVRVIARSALISLVLNVIGASQDEVLEVLLEDVSTVQETKMRGSAYNYNSVFVVSLYGEDMQMAKIGFSFRARDDFYNRFTTLLRNALDKFKGVQPSITPSDPSVRLRQLAALRADGLISEDEFQRKRTEILTKL